MKVRIKFQKYGAMKFIGHLDVMRYFQKAFRRANIDNEYSKGFSPHQIMSFAAPLGVGLTSDSEYVDVQLLSSDEPEVMIERINSALTEGFHVTDFRILKEREENQKAVTAMSLVASADYLVSFKDGYQMDAIATQEKFQKSMLDFLAQEEIIVDKKTKKSETKVDLKPLITLVAFSEQEYNEKRNANLQDAIRESVSEESITSTADTYENGITVYMQLETGSAVNIKPELVMEAWCDVSGIPFEKYAWQVHRLEVYTRDDSDKLIPLDRLER